MRVRTLCRDDRKAAETETPGGRGLAIAFVIPRVPLTLHPWANTELVTKYTSELSSDEVPTYAPGVGARRANATEN